MFSNLNVFFSNTIIIITLFRVMMMILIIITMIMMMMMMINIVMLTLMVIAIAIVRIVMLIMTLCSTYQAAVDEERRSLLPANLDKADALRRVQEKLRLYFCIYPVV